MKFLIIAAAAFVFVVSCICQVVSTSDDVMQVETITGVQSYQFDGMTADESNARVVFVAFDYVHVIF